MNIMQRFESKYIPEPNSGCWLWVGALHSSTNSYGSFRFGSMSFKAHVVAWLLWRGERDGLFVLHHCDNRLCVNPDHLYLGTAADNVRDRDRRQRRRPPKGELNGRAKLTPTDVHAIRNDTRSFAELARAYNMGETTIADIKKHKRWRHVS